MSHEANGDMLSPGPGAQLQRQSHDPPARIENPADLLGEALKRLSPEKTQEILGVAAQAALDLQIRQKQAELDLRIASARLDQTGAAARQMSGAEAFRIEDEHRTGSGYTRVTVSKDKPPERKRGLLGWLLS